MHRRAHARHRSGFCALFVCVCACRGAHALFFYVCTRFCAVGLGMMLEGDDDGRVEVGLRIGGIVGKLANLEKFRCMLLK